jgi:hypothetical protein
MSYTEIRNLPVRYRSWYINRIMEDFQKQKEAMAKSSNQIELKKPDDSFQKMYRQFSKE